MKYETVRSVVVDGVTFYSGADICRQLGLIGTGENKSSFNNYYKHLPVAQTKMVNHRIMLTAAAVELLKQRAARRRARLEGQAA